VARTVHRDRGVKGTKTRLIVCWTAWVAAAPSTGLLASCNSSSAVANGSDAAPSPSDAGEDSTLPDAAPTLPDAGGDSALPDAAPNLSDASADAVADGPHSAWTDGEVPLNHRPAGAACPETRAPVNVVAYCDWDSGWCGGDTCTMDSNCDAGQNGRCEDAGVGAIATHLICSYDQCFDDPECEAGPCVCRPSSSSSVANSCVGGNCKVDSNCGAGGYCSPSMVPSGCGCSYGCALSGYYCHTPGDSCMNDSDCSGGGNGTFDGNSSLCLYNSMSQVWSCYMVTCP
jgi:hypothetical protein